MEHPQTRKCREYERSCGPVVESSTPVYDANGNITDYNITISEANWANYGKGGYDPSTTGTTRTFSANSIAIGETSWIGAVSFN